MYGGELHTEYGRNTGMKSFVAAQQGIGMVALSRIAILVPGVVGIPIGMNRFDKRGTLERYPWLPQFKYRVHECSLFQI